MPPELVTYRRVSTKQQGDSGLGLEGQEIDIERYRQSVGGTILREFTEVETGTNKRHRPVLEKALRHCKRTGARLVVAKIDRLARNAKFLLEIIESGVEVAFCDLPNISPDPAGKFILTNMAAAAELEAKLISQRVTKALGAYKANRKLPKRLRDQYGENVPPDVADAVAGKLGASLPQCRNLSDDARQRGAQNSAKAARSEAIKDDAHLVPDILAWRAEGKSLQAIAAELNAQGTPTRGGGSWSGTQVRRVLVRATA